MVFSKNKNYNIKLLLTILFTILLFITILIIYFTRNSLFKYVEGIENKEKKTETVICPKDFDAVTCQTFVDAVNEANASKPIK
jgi:hypothetical protein